MWTLTVRPRLGCIADLARLLITGLLVTACGGDDGGNGGPSLPPPPPQLALFAGHLGGAGNSDGVGAEARFDHPGGVATDSAGNVYVTDGNNFTIRKITPAGFVSTLAGRANSFGSTDGTGAEARFDVTAGIATDVDGNVYVADAGNSTIRKITPAGVVTTLAGSAGVAGYADGMGAEARFDAPTGLATDSAGNVYVADGPSSPYALGHMVRKVSTVGVVTTLAGRAGVSGSADGTGAEANFNHPGGLATDSANNVYVADSNNSTIRKITPAGVVSTLAGSAAASGSADGTGAEAGFFSPQNIAADNAGNVYVADWSNNTIRKITPSGLVSTLAGRAGVPGYVDGAAAEARFAGPLGIATDSVGNVYVSENDYRATDPEHGLHRIRKITPTGVVSTMLQSSNHLTGLATDSSNNVYVAMQSGYAIIKITPAGAVSVLAGSAGVSVGGLATDSDGNVYVADSGNFTIRKITSAGIVTTLAGSAGVAGYADGKGAEARFISPGALTSDGIGNVYVADYRTHTIRKITPAGVVSTVVGVAGRNGFAPGPLPGVLSYPTGVAIHGTTLYVALYNGLAVVTNLP